MSDPATTARHSALLLLLPCLGLLAGVAMAAGVVQPRTLSVLAPVLMLAAVVFAWASVLPSRGSLSARSGKPSARWADAASMLPPAMTGFLLFAALSALWSPAPLMSLEKFAVGAAFAILVAAGTGVVSRGAGTTMDRLLPAVWIGFLAGATILAIEIATGRALSIAVINGLGLREGQVNPAKFLLWQDGRLVAIGLGAMTRSMSALVLLLPAALAAAHLTLRGAGRQAALAAITIAAVVAIAGSDSQTAKLALLTGGLAALAARLSPWWTRRGLAAAWLLACLAIVPLTIATNGLVADKQRFDTALPGASPAARIAILNAYAEKVLERPILGHGVNSSYVLGPRFDAALDADGSDDRSASKSGMRQHPHNAYMQVWFELGAAGALLFALSGLGVLHRIAKLPEATQPLACATFAIVATVIAPSYGMWQYWFMAAIALAIFMAAMAAQRIGDLQRPPSPPP